MESEYILNRLEELEQAFKKHDAAEKAWKASIREELVKEKDRAIKWFEDANIKIDDWCKKESKKNDATRIAHAKHADQVERFLKAIEKKI